MLINSQLINYISLSCHVDIQVFTRVDPMDRCIESKRADTMNQNLRTNDNNDDNYVTIGRGLRTTQIISDNGNVSDNGNLKDDIDVLRIRTTECNRTDDIDSTEECPNDSFTDEEGDVNYYNHLRRRRYVIKHSY